MFDDTQRIQVFGWLPDWPRIARMVAGMMPLSAAAPHLLERAQYDQDALLWDDVVKVLGNHIPAHRQQRGTCIGHAWSAGLSYLECCDINARGIEEQFRGVSHAGVYGMSRMRAGLLLDSDGSYGAAAAWAVSNWGCISNEEVRDSDTDDGLAVEWGQQGVPETLLAKFQLHLAGHCATVTNSYSAMAALQGRYPVMVCSNKAFYRSRDKDGFCKEDPSTEWWHCMACVGYRGDRRAFCLLQSGGPDEPGGPLTWGQPSNSFWVSWDNLAEMVHIGDSFSVTRLSGWPLPRPESRDLVIGPGPVPPERRVVLG